MKLTVKAEGMLRHHFWMPYQATIALAFADADCAKAAMTMLPGWKQGTKSLNALVWFGDSEALKEQERLLVFFGADENAISSVAHSIDHGDRFECQIEVEAVDPNQLPMFGGAP